MSAPLLSMHDVTLKIGHKILLDHISLTLHSNEIMTIVGPNGAGKSSLLKLMLGLHIPTKGTITRSDHLRIGYMPQSLSISPFLPLTVHRLLTLANPSRALWDEVAGLVQLTEKLLASTIHHLSGGEWQRVLLARALLEDPNLLILDEPTQGIDVHGQDIFYKLIHKLKEEKHMAVLMVSHDLHVVFSKSDKVICVNQHICCEGSPQFVKKNKAYRDLFPLNTWQTLAPYEHAHDHDHEDRCEGPHA